MLSLEPRYSISLLASKIWMRQSANDYLYDFDSTFGFEYCSNYKFKKYSVCLTDSSCCFQIVLAIFDSNIVCQLKNYETKQCLLYFVWFLLLNSFRFLLTWTDINCGGLHYLYLSIYVSILMKLKMLILNRFIPMILLNQSI